MSRREYKISLVVNRRKIEKLIIDSHYEEKHSDSISDGIILKLVTKLDGRNFKATDLKLPYSYFVTDMVLEEKSYRLIWLLEENEIYIGVVNAYRRS